MEIQTNILNEQGGIAYWESKFVTHHSEPLTTQQWYEIQRVVEKMAQEFDYENRGLSPVKDF
jgi:hypothetical protein